MHVRRVFSATQQRREGSGRVETCGFDECRYEEALQSVHTVRDFSMIYDTYVKSEFRLLELQIEKVETGKTLECRETSTMRMKRPTTKVCSILAGNRWTKTEICRTSARTRAISICAKRV